MIGGSCIALVSQEKWNASVSEAWKRQMWEATSWHEVRGPARAASRELTGLGMQWPTWDTIKVDGKGPINRWHVCKDVWNGAC